PVPTLSIVRFANVATPFTAFTGALPVDVPPTGLLSMAIATAPVKLVTVLPDASKAATVAAGVISTPTCVVPGCTPNARCVAGGGGAAVMLNELLVAGVSVPDVAVSVQPVPTLSIVRFANGATPFTAFTGALPVNVPPTGLLSLAIERAPVKLVTVF